MLARLLLAMLLVLGAVPAAAMPAGCHDGGATSAMAMPATAHEHRPHHSPIAVDHGCIGCAALGDLSGGRIDAPLLAPAVAPMAAPARLALGAAAPPTLRPPRAG